MVASHFYHSMLPYPKCSSLGVCFFFLNLGTYMGKILNHRAIHQKGGPLVTNVV